MLDGHHDREIEEARHTTQENLNVITRRGQVHLDLLLCDEASTSIPAGRWIIQHVVNCEAVWITEDEGIEFLFQQNVLEVDIGIYERETCAVHGVFECGTDDLKHGGDACATRDHAKFTGEGGAVLELALGSLDADGVTDLEEGDDTGYVALLVRL
jgi:hypothetical protein